MQQRKFQVHKNVKKHPADVYKTHGSNLKIKKYLGIKKTLILKKIYKN